MKLYEILRHARLMLAVLVATAIASPAVAQHYVQQNLVSDLASPVGGAPKIMDSNLINPGAFQRLLHRRSGFPIRVREPQPFTP